MFHPLTENEAGLSRRHAKEIKLVIDTSQDCLCTNAIVVVDQVGCPDLTVPRCCTAVSAVARREEEESTTVHSAGPSRPP